MTPRGVGVMRQRSEGNLAPGHLTSPEAMISAYHTSVTNRLVFMLSCDIA